MTIKQAIQLIEKNSEYTFFYNASDLENNTKRDYNSTGNIEKVLKDVFEGSNVSYVIKGKEVILKVTKTENTQQVKKTYHNRCCNCQRHQRTDHRSQYLA
jgi:Secretin and TonB N terminus short domain.